MPAMIILMLSTFHLITICFCTKSSIALCQKREINFSQAYVSVLLLMMGNFLAVLFQLLNCTNVGPYQIHFFFGFEECYKQTWWISLIILLIIIGLFFLVFIRLKRMTIAERIDKTNLLNTFGAKYKPQYYYWEFVLLIKRIIIAMFAVSINNTTTHIILY
eukprot:194419_1